MITVTLNGEEKTLAEECNVLEAISLWQLTGKTFAIAVNEQFIPKTVYADTPLTNGDSVEIVVPMQGG